jgi:leucyl aminopeptidase
VEVEQRREQFNKEVEKQKHTKIKLSHRNNNNDNNKSLKQKEIEEEWIWWLQAKPRNLYPIETKKKTPEHLAKTQQIFTKIATNKHTQKKKLDDLFGGWAWKHSKPA